MSLSTVPENDSRVGTGRCSGRKPILTGLHQVLRGDEEWEHIFWTPTVRSGVRVQSFSRPILDQQLREQVMALDNVDYVDGFRVDDLLWADRRKVRGVTGTAGDVTRSIEADLVMDASGRASRLVRWIGDAGIPAPRELSANPRMSYTSRLYAGRPEGDLAIVGNHCHAPRRRRGGAFGLLENDTSILTLFGVDGCPPREEEFTRFAASLPQRAVADFIHGHHPIGPIHHFANLGNRWKVIHRCKEWPEGLAAIGDAVCVFNPVYAQGITVAALQALELARSLDRGEHVLRFQNRAARVIRLPWTMATSTDEAWVDDRQGITAHIAQRSMDRVMARAAGNPDLYRKLLAVQDMRESGDLPHRPKRHRASSPKPAGSGRGPDHGAAGEHAPVVPRESRSGGRPVRR